MKELQLYENLRIKKKTTEDVIASVSTLHDDVKAFEERHRHIDGDFSILQDNITDKFQLLFDAVHSLRKAKHADAGDDQRTRATGGGDARGSGTSSRPGSSTTGRLQRATSVPAGLATTTTRPGGGVFF